MRVISPKMLREFWDDHPDARRPLTNWRRVTVKAEWKTFDDVRRSFATADRYKQFTIFDIGGNKYRLIAAIHYNTGLVYIRHVLTHAQYTRGRWKKE